ncbi:MAG: 3-phosphoshikimate 1-carboxyvinyltransferase, partial [Woeseiaceae bacterium]
MNFVVEPSAIESGTVSVPGDKSISHRALMLGAVASGTTTISGFLPGEDCLATANALRSLGVSIEQPEETEVRITGTGLAGWTAPDGPLDLGNSGTAMRLFAGLLSGLPFSTELTGDESLNSRPMSRVIKPLTMMGASITSDDGRPPLVINGGQKLAGIVYRLPVASAQVKSAILLAGLNASGDVAVVEPAVTRDHT